MFCPNCKNDCGENNVCPNCGTQLIQPQNTQPASGFAADIQAPVAPKAKNPIKILIPIIAIVVVIGIIIASISIVGSAGTPQAKVAGGAEKLLFDAKSFNFDVEISNKRTRNGEYYDEYSGEMVNGTRTTETTYTINGGIAWGDDLASSSYFANINMAQDDEDYNINVASNKGESLVWFDELEDEGLAFNTPAVYTYAKDNLDDIFDLAEFDQDDFEDELDDYYNLDIETIKYWIENIVSNGKINEKLLEEIYNDYCRNMIDDNTDIDADVIPDYATSKKVITNFFKKGLSKEAIVVNEKFKEDGIQKYDISVNAEIVASDLYTYLSECKELEAFLDTDEGDDFMDSLEDLADDDYLEDMELDFIIGVSNGYLSYFEYTVEEEYETSSYETTIKVTLSNFNGNIDAASHYDELYNDKDSWYVFENVDDVEDYLDKMYSY